MGAMPGEFSNEASSSRPLAMRIRPATLADFTGQEHLVGPGKPLRRAIEERHAFSFILWGPPGSGKTTLARIYAASLNAVFFELSAVSAGKEDIRRIVANPQPLPSPARGAGGEKILFLDEIHRFNKAQQDYLLPFVENGALILVGATTENPSFEVIPPLLSRCRVFTLRPLSEAEIKAILARTGVVLSAEAQDWLIAMAQGDARQAITMLENAQRLYGTITPETLRETAQSKHLRYDKAGEEHYNVVSAFIKSMRAGQADAALYYLARMVEAGEDPRFIARRMVIFASEDIGLALPAALILANAVFQAVESIGYPECAINLAHGAAYLALAKKDRRAYDGLQAALEDVRRLGHLPIPLKLRNAATKLMKDMEYGKGYKPYDQESCLPGDLEGRRYLAKAENQRMQPSREGGS